MSRSSPERVAIESANGPEEQRQPQSPRDLRDNDTLSPIKSNFARKTSADSAPSDHKSNDSVSAPSDVTHDSMVTVPLSGPPSLTIDTSATAGHPLPMPSSSLGRSVETIDQTQEPGADADDASDISPKTLVPKKGLRTLEDELQSYDRDGEQGKREQDTPTPPGRSSEDSVDWDQLQKSEHEHKERESDAVSLRGFLLMETGPTPSVASGHATD